MHMVPFCLPKTRRRAVLQSRRPPEPKAVPWWKLVENPPTKPFSTWSSQAS